MPPEYSTSAEPRAANKSPVRKQRIPSNLPPPLTTFVDASLSTKAPMLSASSSNNHSLFSFGRNGASKQSDEQATGSYDFLPSVSFDDLQTSIESASTEFTLTQFPSPTGEGSILDSHTMPERRIPERPAVTHQAASAATSHNAAPATASRPTRSGSILRRPSTSSRKPSISSVRAPANTATDTNTPPVAMRSRRQNHYPPVSNPAMASRPPRRSIGSGVTAETTETLASGQRRRPSLMAERLAGDATTTTLDMPFGGPSDAPRQLSSARTQKAKSVQPPPRTTLANLSTGETLAPEPHRLSTLAAQTPRTGGRGSTPSSANSKRMSTMPNNHHGSHASGLGARTISPTDTRRAKRMSTMPTSQSLSHIVHVPPPPPVSMDYRADSRSPSMIPRRTSGTPSSARTTPDISNRKSYSSGLSIASSTSYPAVRTSTGPAQTRLPASASASRLPAPKHTTVHNPLPADSDEEVPPVPAIPKAYESPKGSPAEALFIDRKKSGLGIDALSIHSNSTGSITMPVQPEPVKGVRKASARQNFSKPESTVHAEKPDTPSSRKNLQPLSLPPINLGPLNIPHLTKTSNQEHGPIDRNLSPPPSRQIPKTPTTPMTASRSTFFSKHRFDNTVELPSLRSSSSVHINPRATPTLPDEDSSVSSVGLKEPFEDHKSSISPFLSSSAPKSGFESHFLKRTQTDAGNHTKSGAPLEGRTHQKPAGPRAPPDEKTVAKSPTPGPAPEEPTTPSSMSSLRRKLSLTWKRDKSKGSNASTNEAGDKSTQPAHPQLPTRQDSMPPPRIPVSATVNSLSNMKQSDSATPKPNGGYLESRRRKSSAASLSTYSSHDRTKSDPWSSKKDTPDASTMPTARHTSVMNKLLKPKSSASTVQNPDAWSTELDKDDLGAEDEMRKMGSRRKETELAARTIDALRKRATRKERVGPHEAIRVAMLNIYERGEIVDYPDIYFCGTQGAAKVVGDMKSDAPNFGYDDDRGDYTIVPGDHLSFRYEIVDILGKGSFGQVVRCIDHKLGVLVAVKIIRNKKRFHQQALVEVDILQKLREWDPHNKHSMVNFTQSFYFRGHLCISTELLDMNLYEFIKTHSFRGFSLRIVRSFTKQILSSLILLKQKRVIHCDLKPENILLRHPLHSEIKVIDFGSSCFENEKVYTYIQSRFYRSPEVILGMTYGLPIDMWSVGCILAELYTGVPIFPGENEQEQLACIMEVFGPPEKHLIEKSTRKKLFFDSMGKPRLTVSSKGRRRRPSSKTLQQVLKCDDEPFLDFLARCLRWDPDRRMKPEEAVRHEFITGKKTIAPPPQRQPTRESSPVKRHNTVSAPRPLPEPPALGMKPAAGPRTGPSPHKPVAGGARRISGATAPTTASSAKRTSTGNNSLGAGVGSSASGLPRAAGRSVSGKQDLAAAGATAAMSRRV